MAPPTGISDRKCSDFSFNQCKCPHGVAKKGADCPYNTFNYTLKPGQDKPQCESCDSLYRLDNTICKKYKCEDHEYQNGKDVFGNVICVALWEQREVLLTYNCSEIKLKFNERPPEEINQPSCKECRNTTYCATLEELWSEKECNKLEQKTC